MSAAGPTCATGPSAGTTPSAQVAHCQYVTVTKSAVGAAPHALPRFNENGHLLCRISFPSSDFRIDRGPSSPRLRRQRLVTANTGNAERHNRAYPSDAIHVRESGDSCCDRSAAVYLPVLGAEKVWSASFVAVLLMTRGTFSLLSRMALGILADRLSRRAILLSTVAMAAALFTTVPLIGHHALSVAIMAILGLGMGVGQPISLAWTMVAVPRGARSTATAVRLMGNRLGQVVLPTASSGFVVFGGAASAFWLTSALLASCAGAVAVTR